MNQLKRIFIVGHPGIGKEVLGKALADAFGWELVDIDFGLEFRFGRTLKVILGQSGALSFHKSSAEILTALKAKEKIIVITDASIVDDEHSRALLAGDCVVYLQVSTDMQLKRVSRNAEPLMLVDDMQTFLHSLHVARDTLYGRVASLTHDGNGSDIKQHVATIIKAVAPNEAACLSGKLKLDKRDQIIYHKITHEPVYISEQQALCLKLLASGKSSKEIAKHLKISYRTVEGYIAKAMEALGCSSSKELIALCLS